jgi:hypothetical protein
MQKFEFNANGHRFEFVCTSRSTRGGFAHDAAVFIDGRAYEAARETCHYINRTWESYTYQTVMARLAGGRIAQHMEWELEDWKEARGYQRMTGRRKEEFAGFIDKNAGEPLRTWIEVYAAIRNHDIMEPPYPEWYGRRPATYKPSYFA